MKKPIQVIPRPSRNQAQSARDRKCATVMAKLLNWWSQEDRAKGVIGKDIWLPLISLEDGTKICGISVPTYCASVMSAILSGDMHTPPPSKHGQGNILGNRPTLIYLDDLERTSNDTKPTWFGPKITNVNLKRGSLATWAKRYTPNYLKGVMNDIKKVRGNKNTGDEKNGAVPVLQKQRNPCGHCPFRHGEITAANSLREAFKAVSGRAEKRNKKTGRKTMNKITYSDENLHGEWKKIIRRAIQKGNFHVGDLVHTVKGRRGQTIITDGYIVSFGIRFGPLLKNPKFSFNKYPFALVSKRGYVKNECARLRAYMLKNLRHGAVPKKRIK